MIVMASSGREYYCGLLKFISLILKYCKEICKSQTTINFGTLELQTVQVLMWHTCFQSSSLLQCASKPQSPQPVRVQNVELRKPSLLKQNNVKLLKTYFYFKISLENLEITIYSLSDKMGFDYSLFLLF